MNGQSPEMALIQAYEDLREAMRRLLVGMLPALRDGTSMTALAEVIADRYMVPLPVAIEVNSDYLVSAMRACVAVDALLADEPRGLAAIMASVPMPTGPRNYGPARHQLVPQG